MKPIVLLTILFPFFALAASPHAENTSLSKYEATVQDPDIKLINGALKRIYGFTALNGGNVSGGGDDLYPLSQAERNSDGDALQRFQLGLIGVSGEPTPSIPVSSGRNRIAVVDSGISAGSRAAKNIVHFQDFTNRCPNGEMCADSRHGTLVTDLIVQAAPAAEIVSLKVLTGPNQSNFSGVVDALTWLNRNHRKFDIRIVNMSLVSPDQKSGLWNDADEARALIKKLNAEGVIIVSPAGNDSKNGISLFPADTPESITVGSYSHHFSNDTSAHTLSPFSNRGYAEEQETTHFKIPLFYERMTRGPKAWHLKPEVLAPGERLFACDEDRCFLATDTSFAAALVSGGLHGLLAKYPGLTRASFLEQTRERCPSPSFVGHFDGTKSCATRLDLEFQDPKVKR